MGKLRPILIIGILLLTACTIKQQAPNAEDTELFSPATLVPTPVPPTPVPVIPTQPPNCENELKFVSDLTIPDGTVVAPGEILDKQWEVENSGTCNWVQDYRLRLITGNPLGDDNEDMALYPARSGTKATIQIHCKVPTEPGNYRSAWQAFDPKGEPFGDPIFIDITVQN